MSDMPSFERMRKAAPNGGYICTLSEEDLASQRGVIWDLVKSFGKNIVAAKELTSISMPVRLFEPRSYLERLSDGWWSAPMYLNKAAHTSDPVERLKLVMTFAVSGFFNTVENQKGKPFNPILGETFQATFEDGTRIYAEQASHHPPITCWQVFGPEDCYHFYGYGEWSASFRGNSVKGHQAGPNIINFADGSCITYSLPEAHVGGIMFGERIIEYLGTIDFRDEQNGLACDLVINPNDQKLFSSFFSSKKKVPTDYLRGEIVRFKNREDLKKPKNKVAESEYEVLSKVQGSWLSCIEFDGERFWEWNDSKLKIYAPILVDNPLPSDSRFREDVQYLAKGDLETAGEFKRKYEQKQRREAALRKEGNDIKKKDTARGNSERRDKRILTVADVKKHHESESQGEEATASNGHADEDGKGKTAA
jgi:hypothetical protein